MLDIKKIREDFDEVKAALERRGQGDFGLGEALALDKKRREILGKVEGMRNEQKTASKQIPALKKEGKDASRVMSEMKTLSEEISKLEEEVSETEAKLRETLLNIPNAPLPEVPVGSDESANVEVRRVGEVLERDFEVKPHWQIGAEKGILDFERAAKISGARFALYKGFGAKLERAVTNFMLDLHTNEHGYEEMLPPFLVSGQSMTGTGQLPKFAEDMFKAEGRDLYLVPTAEVPLTNIHAGEILSDDELPKYYTAYTPCFRKEAGSAGRDTRGLIRLHQFNKVELVKLVRPEDSASELESLLSAAEEVLKRLELPYRVVALATGDLGFSSAMTYDIEVWMPSYGRYVEISSCSNFLDYQARRINLRFRRTKGEKPEFVHTLNGSGLAVGRTTAAILENFQTENGEIETPEALKKYF